MRGSIERANKILQVNGLNKILRVTTIFCSTPASSLLLQGRRKTISACSTKHRTAGDIESMAHFKRSSAFHTPASFQGLCVMRSVLLCGGPDIAPYFPCLCFGANTSACQKFNTLKLVSGRHDHRPETNRLLRGSVKP